MIRRRYVLIPCFFASSYKAASPSIKKGKYIGMVRVYSNNTGAVNQPNFVPVVIETVLVGFWGGKDNNRE